MSISNEEIEIITSALQHYLLPEYQTITDFTKVIQARETITTDEGTIYKYPCPCQTVYLDGNHDAVTYREQFIIKSFYDENDNIIVDSEGNPVDCDETGDAYARAERDYYYDFNPNLEGIAGTYKYINTAEWRRTSNIWE